MVAEKEATSSETVAQGPVPAGAVAELVADAEAVAVTLGEG